MNFFHLYHKPEQLLWNNFKVLVKAHDSALSLENKYSAMNRCQNLITIIFFPVAKQVSFTKIIPRFSWKMS